MMALKRKPSDEDKDLQSQLLCIINTVKYPQIDPKRVDTLNHNLTPDKDAPAIQMRLKIMLRNMAPNAPPMQPASTRIY